MAVPYEASGEVWRGLVDAFLNKDINFGFSLQSIQTVLVNICMATPSWHLSLIVYAFESCKTYSKKDTMNAKTLFIAVLCTFSIYAMEDELDLIKTQLLKCELECYKEHEQLPLKNQMQLQMGRTTLKICMKRCCALHHAQVMMLHAKMLQSKK